MFVGSLPIPCDHYPQDPECGFCAGRNPCAHDGYVSLGPIVFRLPVAEGGVVSDGNKLWPCALALAQIVGSFEIAGMSLLEIGCGLSLPGMVAARQGARVTLCDRDDAVDLSIAELNQVELTKIRGDWATLQGSFDWVVGSEVLYRAYGLESAAHCVANVWNGRGRCLFVQQPYYALGEFVKAIESLGLSCVQTVVHSVRPDGVAFLCVLLEVLR